MSRSALFLAVVILGLPPWAPPLGAWGALGHQLLAGAALQDLPAGPAAWFAGREAAVRGHANDPDQWKREDPLERPRHCLYCEPYGGPALVPLDPARAEARIGAGRFWADGQAPWAILDRVGRLARAFAAGDPDRAAFEAAILSHYVGDLSVPMHTTLNHNGGLTGQLGVHHRWEIGLLERLAGAGEWRPEPRPAGLGERPRAAPWDWLRESFAQIPGLLADDLSAAQGCPGPAGAEPGEAYWRAFLRLQGPRVQEQLTLAGQRTARMILLAWTEAGMPPAPPPG